MNKDKIEFEIHCRNVNDNTKFRCAFDFNKPSEIPDGCNIKISSKTLTQILNLPYDDVVEWFVLSNELPLNFKHFWTFCHRYGGNQYESGDPDSYRKARLILDKLIENKYKMEEIPQFIFASHDSQKIDLIKEAMIKLDCPIHKIAKIENNKKKLEPYINRWNEWLNSKRDAEKASQYKDWGDLQAGDELEE